MNSNQLHDEPIKLHEVAAATVIVVTACAGVAIAFSALAVGQYTGDLMKRIRWKKGGHRAP